MYKCKVKPNRDHRNPRKMPGASVTGWPFPAWRQVLMRERSCSQAWVHCEWMRAYWMVNYKPTAPGENMGCIPMPDLLRQREKRQTRPDWNLDGNLKLQKLRNFPNSHCCSVMELDLNTDPTAKICKKGLFQVPTCHYTWFWKLGNFKLLTVVISEDKGWRKMRGRKGTFYFVSPHHCVLYKRVCIFKCEVTKSVMEVKHTLFLKFSTTPPNILRIFSELNQFQSVSQINILIFLNLLLGENIYIYTHIHMYICVYIIFIVFINPVGRLFPNF
jgi:hypothetical protein